MLALLGALVAAAGYFEFYLAKGAPSAHSLMNTQAIISAALVAATIARSARRKAFAIPAESYGADEHSTAFAFFAIAGSALLAFHGVLQIPFLYDDYTHITDASQQSWNSPLLYFGRVAHPQAFSSGRLGLPRTN
jgi:hypothetical protein